jgi:hypothetical protein
MSCRERVQWSWAHSYGDYRSFGILGRQHRVDQNCCEHNQVMESPTCLMPAKRQRQKESEKEKGLNTDLLFEKYNIQKSCEKETLSFSHTHIHSLIHTDAFSLSLSRG